MTTEEQVLREQIEALRGLKDNYNEEGSPAPSPEAIDWLVWLLPLLPWYGLVPTSVDPDAEGGTGFWFESPDDVGHRTAFLMQSNSGRRFVSVTDHDKKLGWTKQLTPETAVALLQTLASFLKGDSPSV